MAARITPISVLKKSIADIENGHWICGELCVINEASFAQATKKSEVKHMACAVGLVSLYAGHTETVKRKLKGRLVSFVFAVYPARRGPTGTTINDAGRKALEYLYLAMPPNCKNLESAEGASIVELEGAVVEYNDSSLNKTTALKWFQKALRIAEAIEA